MVTYMNQSYVAHAIVQRIFDTPSHSSTVRIARTVHTAKDGRAPRVIDDRGRATSDSYGSDELSSRFPLRAAGALVFARLGK